MAWAQIGGAREYINYGECKAGDTLVEGWYQGTQKGKFNDVHFFRTREGKTIGLNSAGHLNYILGQVSKDEFVKVIYSGKKKLEKGKFAGKEAHTFEAYRAEGGPNPDPVEMHDAGPDEDDPLM